MSLNRAHQEFNARAYRAYAALKPIDATPSRTYTNASTKQVYEPALSAPARPGADDHQQVKSRGF